MDDTFHNKHKKISLMKELKEQLHYAKIAKDYYSIDQIKHKIKLLKRTFPKKLPTGNLVLR